MALIVLEGCDGAGKTTIAMKLAKIMDAQVIHCTAETPNNFNFFCRIMEMAQHRNIIADRWCYGQFVYQTENERYNSNWLTEYTLEELEIEMLRNNVKIIFVTAPPNEIEDRLSLRDEKLTMPIEEIIGNYEHYLNKSIVPYIAWYTGEEQ